MNTKQPTTALDEDDHFDNSVWISFLNETVVFSSDAMLEKMIADIKHEQELRDGAPTE